MTDQMKATDLFTCEQGEHFVTYVTCSDDSSPAQLKRAVAPTQQVNQRCFTESIVLFEMINCFKMYVIKMKKKTNTVDSRYLDLVYLE